MGRDAHIRIGTADRERAMAALADHFAAGRLEVDEYGQRCAAVVSARTRAELLGLFDDLPAPHPTFTEPGPATPAPAPATRPPRVPKRSEQKRTTAVVLGFLVLGVGAIVVVAGVTESWWALAPALLIALVLVMVVS